MNSCTKCNGEGLVHQGESIKNTCEVCLGTGVIAGKTTEPEEMTAEESEATNVPPSEDESEEESFLEESGEESASAPEDEEEVPE